MDRYSWRFVMAIMVLSLSQFASSATLDNEQPMKGRLALRGHGRHHLAEGEAHVEEVALADATWNKRHAGERLEAAKAGRGDEETSAATGGRQLLHKERSASEEGKPGGGQLARGLVRGLERALAVVGDHVEGTESGVTKASDWLERHRDALQFLDQLQDPRWLRTHSRSKYV